MDSEHHLVVLLCSKDATTLNMYCTAQLNGPLLSAHKAKLK